MPGDASYVQQAREEGLIASDRKVCYFVPVILVKKDNPMKIRSLSDLVEKQPKLGLGDSKACAIGRKTSKIFAKNGIDEQKLNVTFRSVTVTELGNHVKVGSLDAAIVWQAVAQQVADDTDFVPIPLEDNIISTVPIGVLTCSERPELAEKFAEFMVSDEAIAIFKKHNYTTSEPK
jgi:molybdate transport system substrate-binding protein